MPYRKRCDVPIHPPVGTNQTLILYANHQRVRGFSPHTIARRAWSLALWVEYLHLHDADLTAGVTILMLEGFLARWPSAQSRYSVRSDIHQLYRWMLRNGVVAVDPTAGLDPPRLPRRLPSPIPAPDVARLIDNTQGRDRLIVMLAACAGLRTSEIANLCGDDVDLEHRTLTVRAGKGGKDATVPLVAELAAELALWPCRGRLVAICGPSVGDRIRTLLRRYGIVGRPHDLRHSFATTCARRLNGDLVAVAQLMRHSDVTTTQRYVQPQPVNPDRLSHLYTNQRKIS